MKTLKQILLEKLKINHKTIIKDFCYPIATKDGKEYLWYKWWKYLDEHGPTSKKDLLSAFDLSVTSYSTMFAKLSRRNIIVPVKGKLVAKNANEWRPNIN